MLHPARFIEKRPSPEFAVKECQASGKRRRNNPQLFSGVSW
jgi:hypothetical protein